MEIGINTGKIQREKYKKELGLVNGQQAKIEVKSGNKNEASSENFGVSFSFFENLPDLLRPVAAASLLGLSIQTIYDWRYRPHQRNVPKMLFIKLNRILYLRTSVLKEWISSQN